MEFHFFMKIVFHLIVLVLFLSPLSFGWSGEVHKQFVQEIYFHIDSAERQLLNLSLLEEGAVAPDRDFHDYNRHHYPPSLNLSLFWLEEAHRAYILHDYNNASYSFGVASHYIDDSFVAPHYISGELSSDHSRFESNIAPFFVSCHSTFVEVESTLLQASRHKEDWQIWMATRDPKIPAQAAKEALWALYPIALTTFNTSCGNSKTVFKKRGLFIPFEVSAVLATLGGIFVCWRLLNS